MKKKSLGGGGGSEIVGVPPPNPFIFKWNSPYYKSIQCVRNSDTDRYEGCIGCNCTQKSASVSLHHYPHRSE